MARRAVAVSRLSNLVILRPLRSLALFVGRCHCGEGRVRRQERSPENLIGSRPLVEEDWPLVGPVTSQARRGPGDRRPAAQRPGLCGRAPGGCGG